MPAAELEAIFPELRASGYRITSPPESGYNCFAWAGGDARNWWQPVALGGYYWPTDVPAELTLENLMRVYMALGYSPCESAELEEGFEKIAVYMEPDGTPTHAARQLSAGAWTSKLGELEDIEHATLGVLEGSYGKVGRIMKRLQTG